MSQYSAAQITQLIARKNASLPVGKKFNAFGKTKAQIDQFLGIQSAQPSPNKSTAQSKSTSKIAVAIGAKTGVDAAKIHAAIKKNAQIAIDRKRQQLKQQGKKATQEDLRAAAIEAIKATAQKAMSAKAKQQAPSERSIHHAIKPHATPYGESGFKEGVRRERSIEAMAQKLEEGRFVHNMSSGIRADEGKSTAITALRDAKNPRVGLISTKNAKGEYTGFLSYKPGGGSIEIVHVGTDQSEKGDGRKMFEELVAEAAKQKKGLTVVAEKKAIGFYEKMGMTHLGHGDLDMSAADVAKAAKR